nr:transposase [Deinococcus sp. Arct2-2]
MLCKGTRYARPRAITEAGSGRGGHGGYSVKGRFYGFKLHAMIDDHGMIVRCALAAGNESDPPLARTLLDEGEGTLALGDWGDQGCGVYAQPKSTMKQSRPCWGATAEPQKDERNGLFSSRSLISPHASTAQFFSIHSRPGVPQDCCPQSGLVLWWPLTP